MSFINWVRVVLIMGMSFAGFAFAEGEAAAGAHAGNPMNSMLMFAVLFGAIYFMMIRPQSKRAKEHKKLLASLEKGDEVVTSGGMLGTITKVTEQFFIVALSQGVEVPVQKNAIANALPKGTIKSL